MLKFLRIERPTSATRRSSCGGSVDHLLDPMHVGGERGDDDPATAAGEQVEQGGTDARLRRRDPGPVGVGRVAAQAEDALPPQLGEARDVGRPAVHRSLVELVVAGDQQRAQLGAQDDRAGVRNRVRHVDQLELERAEAHLLAGVQHLERRVAKPVLLELRAHQADRQRAAVDDRRHPDLAQDVGKRPDVILVPMGEDDRLDVVGVIAKIGEVRQHQVDSQHLGGREHQTGVDHDDPPVVLDDGHVLADLAQPPERQDAKWSRQPGVPSPGVSRCRAGRTLRRAAGDQEAMPLQRGPDRGPLLAGWREPSAAADGLRRCPASRARP